MFPSTTPISSSPRTEGCSNLFATQRPIPATAIMTATSSKIIEKGSGWLDSGCPLLLPSGAADAEESGTDVARSD